MKDIVFIVLSAILMLTVTLPVNPTKAGAQVNLSLNDMKSVTDNINISLTKLVGVNSSN